MAVRKAIFLDKDGTLIPDRPYNVDPDKISLSANTIDGLIALQEEGFMLLIISNQSGIARGFFDHDDLLHVEHKIRSLLQAKGLSLAGFYYCPHHPESEIAEYRQDCSCRKPKPGLLLEAGLDHQIDLSQSWMIGDILHDIEAGHRAGCRAILINNGNETVWEMNAARIPDALVDNIDAAAKYILNKIKRTDEDEKGLPAAQR
ncbi:D,D-heptose 1,7-bisphosphate phosphatase [Pedobacter sp. CAN_A7]|uniref:D-glycero-alpha-D-manno-heptose-1,7-bisphosphate 7-phosphatase n=1 Tax=Pedobacter sp. CAN_A7 TaxID=2787722 RepID=UPI0018CA6E8E